MKTVVSTVTAATDQFEENRKLKWKIFSQCNNAENTTSFVLLIHFYSLHIPTLEFLAKLCLLDITYNTVLLNGCNQT